MSDPHSVPAPSSNPGRVSEKWLSAANTTKFAGDLAALRCFVHAEVKKTGSRLDLIEARTGPLKDARAALCTAVWLLHHYTSTDVRYRLVAERRHRLYKVMEDLASEIGTEEVAEMVARLTHKAPSSRRIVRLGSMDAERHQLFV